MFRLLLALALPGAAGHGAMNTPPSRNAGNGWAPGENVHGCNDGACMWFSQGCSIGCRCNEDNSDLHFFESLCHSKTAPTINELSEMTYGNPIPLFGGNWTKFHPWRAPGTAVTFDACGISGGSTHDNAPAAGFGNDTIVHRQGYPGSRLPPVSYKTVWKLNSTVEVAWGITANHGGGYQYRLCSKDEPLTEACFQRHVLPFVGGTQTLRWADGAEVTINATRVSAGTTPAGSVWTKNPIPACTDLQGGDFGRGCDKPQFAPPPGCNETCWGFKRCEDQLPHVDCSEYPHWNTREIPNIVDRVRVPPVLALGAWVVQWRWDCEQTPQVWNSCGDVTVVA